MPLRLRSNSIFSISKYVVMFGDVSLALTTRSFGSYIESSIVSSKSSLISSANAVFAIWSISITDAPPLSKKQMIFRLKITVFLNQ